MLFVHSKKATLKSDIFKLAVGYLQEGENGETFWISFIFAQWIMGSIYFSLAKKLHFLLNLEKYQSAQQTAHTPFHDMLPHLHTIYDDVILLNVLTEV